MKNTLKIYAAGLLVVLTIGLVLYFVLRREFEGTGITTVAEEQVDMTPAVLDSIKSIGQWELASVDLNVTVDTVQKRWLGLVKDRLQRRYYGRLSIGVDMRKAGSDWFVRSNDTITLYVPEVCLLDSNFIDESRTVTLISENGDFEADSSVKKAMLSTARRRMIHDGMTPATVRDCHTRIVSELSTRFQAIGYSKVVVTFGKSNN